MTSEKIIKNCAPTLAGIKTGNLFNEYFSDKYQLLSEMREFNKVFMGFGINMFLVAIKQNRALVYVYRVNDLKKDFSNDLSKNILKEYGYNSSDIYTSLKKLQDRVETSKEFPHEIGLFLGYPPKDVKGFIDNKGKNSKTFGYWKVYDDENKAKAMFKSYDVCQKTLLERLNMGYSLKQLTIQR